jgi:hypothetical protein
MVWARCGRCGVVLEDTAGYWKDMPEKIEAAVYDGLSEADMDRLEAEPPALFPSPVEAIRWGMDQIDVNGQPVFKDEAHAQNAYDKVKRERQPQSARDMCDAWLEEVMRRKEDVLDIAAQTNRGRSEESPMSWRHSDVDISLWLGVNDIWPSHIVRQADDRHVCWSTKGKGHRT